jgi:CorA-like Mg2+ transporter protein
MILTTVAIIWLDNGLDLTEGQTSWLSSSSQTDGQKWQTRYLPIIQHKPNGAFKRRPYRRAAGTNASGSPASSLCQSSSLLHLDYGRDLDRHAIAADAFYSLNEVFKFAAFSESQFLNMLDSKLVEELNPKSMLQNEHLTLSNTFYFQRALERHICRIKENIESIENRGLQDWPKHNLEDRQREKVDAAAGILLRDYKDLLRRAEDLYDRCNKGTQIMMSNASIRESQKAIVQAEEVTKLTRLAFIFIPLSFLCSFFGMNFKQLGTGTLSIWIWFATSAPAVIMALLLLELRFQKRLLRLASRVKHMTVRKPPSSEDNSRDRFT